MVSRLRIALLALALAVPSASPGQTRPENHPSTIQFTVAKTHAILIPVRINGSSALFLLDTGADDNYVDTQQIDSLFQRDGDVTVYSPTGRVEQPVYRATIVVGSLELRMHAIGIDLSQMRRGCECKAVGILGMSVLRQFSSVEIDFKKKELRLQN